MKKMEVTKVSLDDIAGNEDESVENQVEESFGPYLVKFVHVEEHNTSVISSIIYHGKEVKVPPSSHPNHYMTTFSKLFNSVTSRFSNSPYLLLTESEFKTEKCSFVFIFKGEIVHRTEFYIGVTIPRSPTVVCDDHFFVNIHIPPKNDIVPRRPRKYVGYVLWHGKVNTFTPNHEYFFSLPLPEDTKVYSDDNKITMDVLNNRTEYSGFLIQVSSSPRNKVFRIFYQGQFLEEGLFKSRKTITFSGSVRSEIMDCLFLQDGLLVMNFGNCYYKDKTVKSDLRKKMVSIVKIFKHMERIEREEDVNQKKRDFTSVMINSFCGTFWSPKYHQKFSERFKKIVLMLLICHSSTEEGWGKISRDNLIYNIIPFINELDVYLDSNSEYRSLYQYFCLKEEEDDDDDDNNNKKEEEEGEENDDDDDDRERKVDFFSESDLLDEENEEFVTMKYLENIVGQLKKDMSSSDTVKSSHVRLHTKLIPLKKLRDSIDCVLQDKFLDGKVNQEQLFKYLVDHQVCDLLIEIIISSCEKSEKVDLVNHILVKESCYCYFKVFDFEPSYLVDLKHHYSLLSTLYRIDQKRPVFYVTGTQKTHMEKHHITKRLKEISKYVLTMMDHDSESTMREIISFDMLEHVINNLFSRYQDRVICQRVQSSMSYDPIGLKRYSLNEIMQINMNLVESMKWIILYYYSKHSKQQQQQKEETDETKKESHKMLQGMSKSLRLLFQNLIRIGWIFTDEKIFSGVNINFDVERTNLCYVLLFSILEVFGHEHIFQYFLHNFLRISYKKKNQNASDKDQIVKNSIDILEWFGNFLNVGLVLSKDSEKRVARYMIEKDDDDDKNVDLAVEDFLRKFIYRKDLIQTVFRNAQQIVTGDFKDRSYQKSIVVIFQFIMYTMKSRHLAISIQKLDVIREVFSRDHFMILVHLLKDDRYEGIVKMYVSEIFTEAISKPERFFQILDRDILFPIFESVEQNETRRTCLQGCSKRIQDLIDKLEKTDGEKKRANEIQILKRLISDLKEKFGKEKELWFSFGDDDDEVNNDGKDDNNNEANESQGFDMSNLKIDTDFNFSFE